MGTGVAQTTQHPSKESTLKVKPTSRRSTLIVTTDGAGIAGHAGSAALTELADRLGWTAALAPTRRRRSAHDPGRVVRDLVVSIADGGECLADLSGGTVQPPGDSDHALPLPREERAGCVARCMSGSEGGSGKRAG